MPLFIDLHVDHNMTSDIVKSCHSADKAIQDKYGVRYLQIILNESQGCLFCLMEGPDKESCVRVHQEAHGLLACNLSEITNGDLGALMANKQKDGFDFTINHDGSLDTGNRAILSIHLLGLPEHYIAAKEIIKRALLEHDGKAGESFGKQAIAIFETCTSAMRAAKNVRAQIIEKALPLEVRMGVTIGLPLKETGKFFEEASQSANRFSFISENGEITACLKVKQLYNGDITADTGRIKIIAPNDEKLLKQVMDCVDECWNKSEVKVDDFTREVGISKSQLTRKIRMLTGMSPNDFLNEVRLRNSVHLLEEESNNVSEAALAIGFSNPSYFTKLFRKRFGKAPSDIRQLQVN
jgi:AraC-like DNA-binding protein